MRNIIALLFFSFACLSMEAMRNPFEVDPSQRDKPPTLRILLAKEAPRLLVEVRGRYQIISPSSGVRIDSGKGEKCALVQTEEKGLSWGNENYPGVFAFRIVPANEETSLLVNGTQYRGCIEIYDRGGKLTALEEIDLERYIKATLNLPFQGEQEAEVLEAAAVVARTHALYLSRRAPHAFWDVDAKEIGYRGCITIAQNPALDAAVDRTLNLVMTYQGKAFPADWTKDAAGRTVSYATLHRTSGSTPRGAELSLALKGREQRTWSATIPCQKLASLCNLPNISGVDLFTDSTSKKVYAARVRSSKSFRELNFTALQEKLPELKSSEFTVQIVGDKVHFKGFGEGPGTGLCLYSAHQLTERGQKAKQLLTAFFPEAEFTSAQQLTSKN